MSHNSSILTSANSDEVMSDHCKIHEERLRIVCLRDKCRICHDCALFGNHKGHSVKLASEILDETKIKVDKLKVALGNLETYHHNLQSSLEKERVALIEDIQEKFKELRKVIDYKERELLGKIDTFFKIQEAKSNQVMGVNSNIRKNLISKIADREKLFETDDFFSIMQEDISPLLSQLNSQLFQSNNDMIIKSIKDMTDSLNRSLSEQFPSLVKLDLPYKEIVEEAYAKFLGKCGDNPSIVKLETSLNFRVDNEVLKISTLKSKKEECILNPKEWRAIKKVQLTLGNYESTQEDLKLFYYILSKLDKFSCLLVKFRPEGLSDQRLFKILPVIFGRIKNLQEINISLEGCDVGDPSLMFLFDKILYQIPTLKSLCLNLNFTDLTDKTLQVLGKKTLPLLKDLQTLKINLYNTEISDEGVAAICVKMKALRIISLSLAKTGITNKCIEPFVNNILKNNSSFDSFELYLSDTKVTDDGFTQIFENMKDSKRIGLGISKTKATDNSFNLFLQKTLPRLKSLSQFCVFMHTTKLSEQSINRVGELMEKYKWLWI